MKIIYEILRRFGHKLRDLTLEYKKQYTKKETKKLKSKKTKVVSQKIIKLDENIKLLTLGDSVSAGWDGSLDKDYPGKFENGELSGISYSTYLSWFLLDTFKERFESFYNYAISGCTFWDWNYLFEHKYDQLDPLRKIKMHYFFDADLESYYQNLVKKINESNLITISLGGIDFFILLFMKLVRSNLPQTIVKGFKKGLGFNFLMDQIVRVKDEILQDIKNEEIKIINHIKKINPNANLIFVGYPKPFAIILSAFEEKLKEEGILDKNGRSIFEELNEAIKEIALENNVNYIEIFEENYWSKNLRILTPLMFDIHPSIVGYKKMAIDLFIKLLIDRDKIKDQYSKLPWPKEFLDRDQDTFKCRIEINQDPFEIFEKRFTKDSEKFLLERDKFYKAVEDKFSELNYEQRVLTEARFSNAVFETINILWRQKFYDKIDPDHELSNYFLNNKNSGFEQLKSWVMRNKFLSSFLITIQNNFLNSIDASEKNNNWNNLLRIICNTFFDEEKIVKLIISFFPANIFKSENLELKLIVKKLIINIINSEINNTHIEPLVNYLYKFLNPSLRRILSKDLLLDLIVVVFNKKQLKNKLIEAFSDFANDSSNYNDVVKFKDLFNIFISKRNIENIRKINSAVSKELLSDDKFKNIIAILITNFINEKAGFILEGIDKDEFRNLIFDIINGYNKFENEYKFFEILSTRFLNLLSKVSLKEINFSLLLFDSIKKIFKQLEDQDIDGAILKLFKILFSQKHKVYIPILKKLNENIVKMLRENKDLIQNISNFILDGFGDLANKKLINRFINSGYKLLSFYNNIIDVICDIYSIPYSEIESAKTLIDLLKILYNRIISQKLYNDIIKKTWNFAKDNIYHDSLFLFFKNEFENIHKLLESLNISIHIESIFTNDLFKKTLNDFITKQLLANNSSVKGWLNISKNFKEFLDKCPETKAKLSSLNKQVKIVNELNNLKDSLINSKNSVCDIIKADETFIVTSKLIYWVLKLRKWNIENDKLNLIKDFLREFNLSFVKSDAYDNIINSIFAHIKKAELSKIEQFVEQLKNIVLSSLSAPTYNSRVKFKISRVIDYITSLKNIVNEINPQLFVDLVNMIFESSPKSGGIYNILFGQKNKKIKIRLGNIFKLSGKNVSKVLQVFIEPFVKSYFSELKEKNRAFESLKELKQNSKTYQALWRFYVFVNAFAMKAAGKKIYSLLLKKTIKKAFWQSFENLKNEFSELKDIYANKLKIIGFNNKFVALDDFLSGYNSNKKSYTSYQRDEVMSYLYYLNEYDWNFNPNETRKDVLIDDLINGYMLLDDKKDKK
ncbi:SGNH/GDSL hydrolase family protein [Mycoplasmopsis caviae]|uniref:SGNH/GDSL hydrolase family protein n=1 Tax=Mycoplasmopsis caviae TaxID=55603 RepID=A0A3P8LHU4_9BACT|nr:SGNH/GDSL hydrolase family protein [Mycoplasmopsis caviae]UUD35515.1 SGNH/GDSL hydrolase family protein [Mycoplasmopsis caviae]VDR41712.1 Uncharacterised protein [Mycoplasmopsis caviae]